MSETMKRITITVNIAVALVVDADIVSGDVEIVDVVSMIGLPSATDVMEALDHYGEMQQLDEAYEQAEVSL